MGSPAPGAYFIVFTGKRWEEGVTPEQVHLHLQEARAEVPTPPALRRGCPPFSCWGYRGIPVEDGSLIRPENREAPGRNQRGYVQAVRNHDVCFGIGPAGTGNYLAVACAVEALETERGFVFCPPGGGSGEKLGFLPGDLSQKSTLTCAPL